MAPIPNFLSPPTWANQDLLLYHGTIDLHAKKVAKKVDHRVGNPLTDFGRGFYTTTSRRQARSWAWQLAIDHNAKLPAGSTPVQPRLVRFRVPLDALAPLHSLSFVRGDFQANHYWSLVHHCRSGGSHHGRRTRGGWYDLVGGPVAAVWRTRLMIANADQYSFHTARAVRVLNSLPATAKRIERVL